MDVKSRMSENGKRIEVLGPELKYYDLKLTILKDW